MSDIEVTVRGTFTAFAPAERATVSLIVGLQGPEAAAVISETTRAADAVRGTIERLHSPASGPVTWWSSQQLHTWSQRPWTKDGKQLPLVHSARVQFEVKFSDFTALSGWMGEVGGLPGVSVNGIDWALTSDRRKALVDEVRVAAVRDAVAKAQAYASAFGLQTVRAISVADAGMLGIGRPDVGGGKGPAFSRAAAAGGGGGSDPQFAPRDIAVEAEVDARFIVN